VIPPQSITTALVSGVKEYLNSPAKTMPELKLSILGGVAEFERSLIPRTTT
jgi:hypothetical protein